MPSPTELALILWGEGGHPGLCCACCDGYCPRAAAPKLFRRQVARPLVEFLAAGDHYIGNHYIVMRAALVELPEEVTPQPLETAAAWVSIPSELPPLYTGLQTIANADRIDRAGLAIRDSGHEKVVYLYRADLHVGWTTRARAGWDSIKLAQLPVLRRYASAFGVSLGAAKSALDELREGRSMPHPE